LSLPGDRLEVAQLVRLHDATPCVLSKCLFDTIIFHATVHLASITHDIAGMVLISPIESGIRSQMGSATSFLLYPLDIFRNYQKISKVSSTRNIFFLFHIS
jgi:hypothetical protein